jgi:hypothetical protein
MARVTVLDSGIHRVPGVRRPPSPRTEAWLAREIDDDVAVNPLMLAEVLVVPA